MTNARFLSLEVDNTKAKRPVEETTEALQRLGTAAKDAATATNRASDALDAGGKAAAESGAKVEKTTARLAAYSRESAALETQYKSLSGTMRELEALRLQVERNKVVGVLAEQRTVVQSLMSDLDGLECPRVHNNAESRWQFSSCAIGNLPMKGILT